MANLVMSVLAASVALGYFVIAIVVAPRIRMPTAPDRLVLAIRGAAIAFFIGCGATHVHIFLHSIGVAGATEPVEAHEIVFHSMQALGAWLFIIGAVMRLELHVVPSPQRAELRAAVEEQRRLAAHATKRAGQDELTGLARRWRFEEELERQVARAGRDHTPATLLLVDLDDLKTINDTMGHQAGDAVLRHVAAAIDDQIRASDFAGRIGGDEFAIILSVADADDAGAAATRIIRAALGPGPVGEPRTSVSAGSAPIDGSASPAEIMRRADVALYAAKRNGGNCHVGSELTAAQPVS